MKFNDTWNLGIDDEYREYLNLGFSTLVIFILIALALDSYENHVRKAQISELYHLAMEVRNHSQEYYAAKHTMPSKESMWTHITASKLLTEKYSPQLTIHNVRFSDGMWILEFNSNLDSLHKTSFSLRPVIDPERGTVIWLCGYASAINAQVSGFEHATTLPRKYLPRDCR